MPLAPPARIGMALAAVDTPALILDLDAFERNVARMAQAARRLGVRLRPHAKSHKSPRIAERQIAAGAVGQCCQKVSEAEVLVEAGIADVLVTNEIVGAGKLDRLAALARTARIGVCCDDAANVRAIGQAAEKAGVRIDVYVEIDVGGRRCGIAPGAPAAGLARAIAATPSLSFAGVHAYYGSAQHMRSEEERRAAIASAGDCVRVTREALAAAGIACPIVTGAGTGTFEHEGASGLWNEIQPGSYIFMDADYARNRKADGGPFDTFEHALFVRAGVMSRPAPERAVIDAGHKALSNDSGFPTVWGDAAVAYHRPSDEHGILDLSKAPGSALQPGDAVLLVPGHCDPTVNLHDWFVGVRGLGTPGARVAEIWPVAARGAVF